MIKIQANSISKDLYLILEEIIRDLYKVFGDYNEIATY